MKKNIISLALIAAMALSMFTGCVKPKMEPADKKANAGATEAAKTEGGNNYELALITDVGTIDDKSFNQGSWEGLVKYAKEHNITHKYYKPTEKSDAACLAAIDLAVKGGAKVVVTPGFLFETSVYEAQTKYPKVKFVIIDAAPTKNKKTDIKDNVLSIFYAEGQAGYLAGYAAVVEGYRNLGFMGGIAVPAVVRFGYGFIQGVNAAAKELNVPKDAITLKYTYLGNFAATPENQTKAAAWFNEGAECIFACAGGAGNSVMKAAESANKAVIGVDVDQSVESKTVITSAMKNLSDSVYNALASYYDNKFVGGKSVVLGAAENGIQLPMATSKLKKFTQADYDRLYKGLKDGTIKVVKDTDVDAPEKVPADNVKVEVIK